MCGLETFTIVATFLHVSYGRAEEGRTVLLGNGEQGDFAVELDKFFNDKLTDIATTATAIRIPRRVRVRRHFSQAIVLCRKKTSTV